MYKLFAAAIGVALIAAVAFGCGSSGTGTATAQATKNQFLAQANAVCAKVNEEIKAQEQAWEKAKGEPLHSFDVLGKQILGPLLIREAKELEVLTPPEGDEATVSQMTESLLQGATAAAQEGEKSTSKGIGQFQDASATYGMKNCAEIG